MTSRAPSSVFQPYRPPFPLLFLLILLLLFFPSTSLSQQIGSFFTAIYLNGAPIASNQESCSNMGQGQYCCGAGQSCAWDDSGHVACCASGSNCQGSPYGGAGAGAGAYNYQSSASSYYQVTPITTTVFTGQTDCNCQSTPNNNVVPVVPDTKAPATITTSYYVVPTSTYYPAGSTTTTTVPGQQGQGQGQGQVTEVVPASGGGGGDDGVPSTRGLIACASVSTITAANVGQPVRTVGCLIIFNKASRTRGDLDGMTISMMAMLLSFGLLLGGSLVLL